jgi:protein ImuA
MQGLSRIATLEQLRARIQNIEKRTLFEASENLGVKGKEFSVPGPGILHEVFADSARDSGAALGFALTVSHSLMTPQRPAILVVQAMADSQEKGVLYGGGMVSLGLDPERIILCRPETPIELLWAIEEAIACRAISAVIADIGDKVKALDFTASRRLSLRAASGGSSVFLLRYGTGREATAARLRWRIEPAASGEKEFDPRAPGLPRWRVVLEKGRLGTKRDPLEWMLDWTQDGFALVKPQTRAGTVGTGAAPLSGAQPAALGDRLPEAG